MPNCTHSYDPKTRRCRSKAQHDRMNAAPARGSRTRGCTYSRSPTGKCRSKAEHERFERSRDARKSAASPAKKKVSVPQTPYPTKGSPKTPRTAKKTSLTPRTAKKPPKTPKSAKKSPTPPSSGYVRYAKLTPLIDALQNHDRDKVLSNIDDMMDMLKRIRKCVSVSHSDVQLCAQNLVKQGVGENPYVSQFQWLELMENAHSLTPASAGPLKKKDLALIR